MDFVWIYAKKFSYFAKSGGLFNELDYSIRSIRKNFQGEVRCFVVGDDPELDGVSHVKGPPLVTNDPINREPVNLDLLNKLDAIAVDTRINEEYILMYDDIFILKPITEEELKISYGRAEVTNPMAYIKTRRGGRPYKRLWVNTYEYIVPYRRQRNLKTYDWETHLPRYIEKTKMDWLIRTFNLKDIHKIPTSLYSAYYTEESEIIQPGFQSDIWTHFPGMDFDEIFKATHLNIFDDVMVPEFLERMYERFGQP